MEILDKIFKKFLGHIAPLQYYLEQSYETPQLPAWQVPNSSFCFVRFIVFPKLNSYKKTDWVYFIIFYNFDKCYSEVSTHLYISLFNFK